MTEVHHIRPGGNADAHPAVSIEAEQMLLGHLLICAEDTGRVVSAGGEQVFHEPLHARIFSEVVRRQQQNLLVSPVTLKEKFEDDDTMRELGGPAYLARLAGAAPARASIPGYLAMLVDLRRKRDIGYAVQEAQRAIVAGEDGADHIAARLEAALIASEPAGNSGPVSMLKAVTGAMDQIHAAYMGEDAGAVQTGIHALDQILGGLYPGDLVYLGGRPSMGKTAAALSMALNAGRAGRSVAIASLEMTPEAMAMRALSEATANGGKAVEYKSMRRGDLSDFQVASLRASVAAVRDLPITFLPRQYNDVGALMAGVKQVARSTDLKLVIVDYLQLMRSAIRGNTNEQVSDISKSLKSLAMQLNVPVLALSQLSRAVESRNDKRPQLSDLRDSGSIEQDADAVMFCYRHEYYLEREEPNFDELERHAKWQGAMEKARNRLDIIVAKQRQGDIGTARVRCNPALNLIWED